MRNHAKVIAYGITGRIAAVHTISYLRNTNEAWRCAIMRRCDYTSTTDGYKNYRFEGTMRRSTLKEYTPLCNWHLFATEVRSAFLRDRFVLANLHGERSESTLPNFDVSFYFHAWARGAVHGCHLTRANTSTGEDPTELQGIRVRRRTRNLYIGIGITAGLFHLERLSTISIELGGDAWF